jgi:DNA-binding CsgD family transcriptional regulator/tetratricopeptide (TPR) repeat protein
MVLLERERELAEFDVSIDQAKVGEGRAVAVEAAAGLGKTRLLREVREAGSEAGLTVLSARATELERDFPFALVRQLFEAKLAALPPDEREQVLEGAAAARGALGLDPGDGRAHDTFAVLHGLYWVTAALAERGSLLLAVDDAHTADAASLDYLGFLLPRLEELPVLLVVTSRPDEPDPSGALRRIVTDAGVRHMTLAPLSAEATTTLLEQELDRQPAAEFANACFEVSGGNPFLLRELAATLVRRGIDPSPEQASLVGELVPERVAQSVLMRVERLSRQAGAVARSLAVLGDETDLGLVAELADVDPEEARAAAEALRASVILDSGSSPRFIHPLVRNAVYADIPVEERERAHARAAELLREQGAEPERIATQLLEAEARGDRAVVETLTEAGRRALATGAPRSALAYLMRALSEPAPDDLRAGVLRPLISASFRTVDHGAWAAIEPEVLAELERDPSLRSAWAVPLTRAMAMGGRFEEAASVLVEAVEVAVSEDDVHRAFQLEAQLATLAQMVPSAPKVDLSRYLDQIDPDSPTGRLAAAIEARAAAVDGSARDAAAAAKRALGNDGAIFTEEPELVAATMAVMTLAAADEVDAARIATERALAVAREREAIPGLVMGLFLKGFVAWNYGDLLEAEADVRQALDLARMAGLLPLAALIAGPMTEILVARDKLEEAEAELRSLGVADGPIPDNPLFSLLLFARGHLRFERGEMERCLEDFHAYSAHGETMGFGVGPSLMVAPFSAWALVATGEREKACELADEAMAAARRWGAPAVVSLGARAVAVGRGGEEGVRRLEEAAEMLEGSSAGLTRPLVLADLGEALRREGRRAEARAPLREALKLARQGGAARVGKRAAHALQACGETVRRYTPIGVESLTPSERRVADLAASGMTNRQIAQSLFVTVKTVEAHLSAAYDKLDIDSRRQLPTALRDPDAGSQ